MLKYVVAKENVVCNDDVHDQCLTKGSTYPVIQSNAFDFEIVDDNNDFHWFELADCDYLTLCYEE